MQDIASEIAKITTLTGETDENLITILLEDAEAWILAYTNRTVLPAALDRIARDLAIISLNRMGTEGEAGRSEGGESYTFDNAPPRVYDILNRYRLARAGGVAHEAKTKPD